MQVQEKQYGVSQVMALTGLEPEEIINLLPCPPARLLGSLLNPALRCPLVAKLSKAMAEHGGPALEALRHFKEMVMAAMRRLREFTVNCSRRATMVVGALQKMACRGVPSCISERDRCWRYIRLTAEHDDARRECATWGLAAL